MKVSQINNVNFGEIEFFTYEKPKKSEKVDSYSDLKEEIKRLQEKYDITAVEHKAMQSRVEHLSKYAQNTKNYGEMIFRCELLEDELKALYHEISKRKEFLKSKNL